MQRMAGKHQHSTQRHITITSELSANPKPLDSSLPPNTSHQPNLTDSTTTIISPTEPPSPITNLFPR
ncbi:hypothetical protein TWF281_009710 [Arthrobotrys megalospora]